MEKIFNKDLYLNYKSEYSPDDFHHVAFKTTNYEEMVEFYKKLFGCEPLYQSNQITFLAFDDEHHRVAIANTSDVLKNLGFIPKLIIVVAILFILGGWQILTLVEYLQSLLANLYMYLQ